MRSNQTNDIRTDRSCVSEMLCSLRAARFDLESRVHPEKLHSRFRNESPFVQNVIQKNSGEARNQYSSVPISRQLAEMIHSAFGSQFCINSSTKAYLDIIAVAELPNLIEKLALLQFALAIFRFPETSRSTLSRLNNREQRAVITAALNFGMSEADYADQAKRIIAACLADSDSELKLTTTVGLRSLAEAVADLHPRSLCALRNKMSFRFEQHFSRLLGSIIERESLNQVAAEETIRRAHTSMILNETIKSHYQINQSCKAI